MIPRPGREGTDASSCSLPGRRGGPGSREAQKRPAASGTPKVGTVRRTSPGGGIILQSIIEDNDLCAHAWRRSGAKVGKKAPERDIIFHRNRRPRGKIRRKNEPGPPARTLQTIEIQRNSWRRKAESARSVTRRTNPPRRRVQLARRPFP